MTAGAAGAGAGGAGAGRRGREWIGRGGRGRGWRGLRLLGRRLDPGRLRPDARLAQLLGLGLGLLVALGRGHLVPAQRLGLVRPRDQAHADDLAHGVLGRRQAELAGTPEPALRLALVLGNALAAEIGQAQVELRDGVVLFGGDEPQLGRALHVPRHAAPLRVHEPEVVLCRRHAAVGRALVPLGRLGEVLLDLAAAVFQHLSKTVLRLPIAALGVRPPDLQRLGVIARVVGAHARVVGLRRIARGERRAEERREQQCEQRAS